MIGLFVTIIIIFAFTILSWIVKRRASDKRDAELISLDTNRVYPLSSNKRELRIGRSKDNDIIVSDRWASRRHCLIEISSNGYIIRDLNSRNGTIINGEILRNGNYKELKNGDVIRVGNARFKFSYNAFEPSTPSPVTPKGYINISQTPITVLQKVGEGGMAEVFKVRIGNSNSIAALKVLRKQFATEDLIIKRFEREIKIHSSLRHPNIVAYLGSGRINSINTPYSRLIGLPALLMEFENSPTIFSKYTAYRIKVPIRTAVNIAVQVCDALSYIHSQEFIHRDIKPSNIFLGRRVKIADFGIAKFKGVVTTISIDTSVLGTIKYVSPEIARGIKEIDERSDLYSLGVVLYEMVAGRPPFEGNFYTLLEKHIREAPIPPNRFNSLIPSKLNYIIMKLLKKDPGQRYRSAIELKQDLMSL